MPFNRLFFSYAAAYERENGNQASIMVNVNVLKGINAYIIVNGTENKKISDIQIQIDDMIRSKEFPALANKLEVKQDNIVGRHVVAKESLKLGETVLTESPYAAVLYPENNGKNCHNCFK